MPAKYVRPYSRGQKNDFREAEAIAEAVQRPTILKSAACPRNHTVTCVPTSTTRSVGIWK
jgi:hypothetical protein